MRKSNAVLFHTGSTLNWILWIIDSTNKPIMQTYWPTENCTYCWQNPGYIRHGIMLLWHFLHLQQTANLLTGYMPCLHGWRFCFKNPRTAHPAIASLLQHRSACFEFLGATMLRKAFSSLHPALTSGCFWSDGNSLGNTSTVTICPSSASCHHALHVAVNKNGLTPHPPLIPKPACHLQYCLRYLLALASLTSGSMAAKL